MNVALLLAGALLFVDQERSGPPRKPLVQVVSVRPDKAEVKVGETFRVIFELEIPEKWHIYPARRPRLGKPTEFLFEGGEVAGEIEEPTAKIHQEADFEYDYHEGRIIMTAPMRLTPGPSPGPLVVNGKVKYQICDPATCKDASTAFSFPIRVLEGVVVPPSKGDTEFAQRGFIGLVLLGMLGGLISLLMPCTYPLIPITLTYFVKQAAGSRRHGMMLSSVYSFGIVSSFTGLGFVLTLLLGAGGARIFAASPWVNVVVALLFLGFTGSLFGWYEIQLPFGLGDKLAGGRRKGVGGAFLLGLLFSIVTFTCTIPIAATILSVAAGQHRWAALVAMFAYSLTMALPFFVLGFFPGMIKEIPKSGGWLATIKVTMAWIEMGLAIFYLSKADQAWEFGVLRRPVVIALWLACAAMVAAYLLHFFRRKPSLARIGFAVAFLAFGGYMASGITGRPLGILEIIVPPPPIEGTTLPAALAEAKKQNKPLFAEFTGVT